MSVILLVLDEAFEMVEMEQRSSSPVVSRVSSGVASADSAAGGTAGLPIALAWSKKGNMYMLSQHVIRSEKDLFILALEEVGTGHMTMHSAEIMSIEKLSK